MSALFECVPNVSEGRDAAVIESCARAIVGAGAALADQTSDPVHHRSVFTFFGPPETVIAAAVALAEVTVARIDLRTHRGAHPRIGALDVLPFVPVREASLEDAAAVAREAAARIWERSHVPSFLYGAAATRPRHRSLPNVRRGEFEGLATRTDPPDFGANAFHPSAGAIAVGARPFLIAYNVVLASNDLGLARRIATTLRARDGGLRTLRALGLHLDERRVQVSFNLTDVDAVPLDRLLGLVRLLASRAGVALEGGELIGLVPRRALEHVVARRLGYTVASAEVPATAVQ
ncbi:MAG: glutamate formimidoyltransferase [Candidatus Baltobacteraceae bacterium]